MFDQQAQILDGVLPSELGLVSDIEKDGKIEDADLAEIIPFYRDTFLPSKLANLQQVIKNDSETEKAYNKLKFTESVINGRITVVESEQETDRRAKAKKVANRAIHNANASEKAARKAEFKNFVNRATKKSRK
jgi:hypothetical protein